MKLSRIKIFKNSDLCNNCGKYGHLYKNCRIPITSFGIIIFRIEPESNKRQYLMIRRKDTLGYMDLIRGKYEISDPCFIRNMIRQMTVEERENVLSSNFDTLWCKLWGLDVSNVQQLSKQYKTEELLSRDKFHLLKTNGIFKELVESIRDELWTEPEWGFPKGRRNYLEKDFDCALRETTEETGFPVTKMINIHNVLPFEEIFVGSNYKSYKHKYYLMYMKYNAEMSMELYERGEVGGMEWKDYNTCIQSIRPYNVEKIRLLMRVEETLNKYQIV